MLTLHQATNNQLSLLLEQHQHSEIDGLFLPQSEEIAPRFLLEFVMARLSQNNANSFWWFPRLIVVNSLIVGMCSFKSPPDLAGSVEIGYGIVASQQNKGLATQAVNLLVREAFSQSKVKTILADTTPHNQASSRVLEKNHFVRCGSKLDLDDGIVWIWHRTRSEAAWEKRSQKLLKLRKTNSINSKKLINPKSKYLNMID